MKRSVGLLVVACMGMACSEPSSNMDPSDMGASQDLSAEPRLSLSLVAGGLGGSGNLDGIGSAARFGIAQGITADRAGSLYIADSSGSTIRKVVAATGEVTTLAGDPGSLFGSYDGTGAGARFYNPHGVAVDAAGNLYVTDNSNNTIRKVVVATGAVTTLAGTAGMTGSTDATGPAARFSSPRGVVVDTAGSNLYVADANNHVIRKVVVATGVVTTLAGAAGMTGSADGSSTVARFNRPAGLALDGAGNLYVADADNHIIRKVVVATGVVTTLAGAAGMTGSADGTTAARFKGPHGLALDGADNLYVTDGNQTVRKVVVATGVVTTLAGTVGMSGSADGTGAAALFNNPVGLAADGAGSLYVVDGSNCAIRKLLPATGVVTTLAGSAAKSGSTDGTGADARFGNQSSVVADGAGNLYLIDRSNHNIRKVVAATGVVTTVAGTAGVKGVADGTGTAALFDTPRAGAMDSQGNLYVADTGNKTIRKVVPSTGLVTTIAGSAGMAGTTDGNGAAARFNDPAGMVFDGTGSFYVSDRSTIRKVALDTNVTVTTLAGSGRDIGNTDGTGAAARFNFPSGLALDGAGNLYVADQESYTVRKVVVSTGAVTTLAGTADFLGNTDGTGAAARFMKPIGLSLDAAGNLYVADLGSSAIRKIQTQTGVVTTVVGVPGQRGVRLGPLPRLNAPQGVTALPSGELYISAESSLLLAR